MNEAVKTFAEGLGVRRLCHFTPSRNLAHIATGSDGLLSTAQLSSAERKAFTQQDRERLDQHPDHICCSIEYPNAWYFRRKSSETGPEGKLFKDWVVLLLAPDPIWDDGTLFCPVNASRGYGRYIVQGLSGIKALYEPAVAGAGGQTRKRGHNHPCAYPTDDQAEVLVHQQIPNAMIEAVCVRDEAQARRHFVALTQLGVDAGHLRFIVAPTFFDAPRLSSLVRAGKEPSETPWQPPNEE